MKIWPCHRRGTWQPAALARVDLWVLLFGLILIATVRGADYATGNDAGGTGLSLVEDAFPLWVWAILLGVGVLALMFGVISAAHMPVWAGHIWLAGLYYALGLGIALSAFPRPWWDGVRSAADLLLLATVHFLVGMRTGPRPDDSGTYTVDEQVLRRES